jgi:hypothetical protein
MRSTPAVRPQDAQFRVAITARDNSERFSEDAELRTNGHGRRLAMRGPLITSLRKHAIPLLVFSAAFVFLALTMAQEKSYGPDECYYILAGKGYMQFLLAPSGKSLSSEVVTYLHPPAKEAAGWVNHPFFAKLVIGIASLMSHSADCVYDRVLGTSAIIPASQLFWARFPSTLMGALGVFAVFSLLFHRFGIGPAILGGLLLLSDSFYLEYSRLAQLNVYGAAFLVSSLVLLISSRTARSKMAIGSAILSGLMLSSRFAAGIVVIWVLMLVIVFKRGGLSWLFSYALISLGTFFLINFYYFMLPSSYLLNAFLAQGRGAPERYLQAAHLTEGPLVGFLLNFYWYIPRDWGPTELTLVVISLILAAFMKSKGIDRVVETDIAFLGIIVLGSFTWAYEGPLVLVAPIAALFVATTIATFANVYRFRPWVIYSFPIAALLTQMLISPTTFHSMYIPYYSPPFISQVGSVVLISLAVFSSGLLVSSLKKRIALVGREEEKTTVDLLVDLVDEDFDQRWHRPGIRALTFYFGFVMVWALPFVLIFAAFRTAQLTNLSFFAIGVATLGIALAYYMGSVRFLELARQQRFARICKKPRFEPLDDARNKLIVHALILIRESVPTKLRETMIIMPDLFVEETLLRYALDRQFIRMDKGPKPTN